MTGLLRILAKPAKRRLSSQDFALAVDGTTRIAVSVGNFKCRIENPNGLFLVVDGLGAHAEPRRAAAIAAKVFASQFIEQKEFSPEVAAEIAHRMLQKRSSSKGHLRCSGAALAGLHVNEHRTLAFGCGDVGIFVDRETVDHVPFPVFPPERNSGGQLTNCIGGTFSEGVIVNIMEVTDWTTISICSDGFWEPREDNLHKNLVEAESSSYDLEPQEDDQALLILSRR